MAWSFRIGSIAGTAVRIHYTFLLFLVWIGISLYAQGGASAAAGGITFLLLLFLCVVLHEFGHILAARQFGVRTPEVVLLPIGGMARLERIPERPREELLIALAGPAVTLTIALLLVLGLGGLPAPEQILSGTGGRNFVAQLAYANLSLLVFNLIPAFPLDGGRVLRALLSARMGHLRATQVAAGVGKAAAVAFGLIGLAMGHVILVLIAFFIYLAAGGEAGLARMRGLTSGVPAHAVMITAFERLAPSATLSEAAEALLRTSQSEFPVVGAEGGLIGMVTREAIVSALAARPAATQVAEVMRTDVPAVSEWHRLDGVLPALEAGAPAVAVHDGDGRLVGLVTWENLLEQLMIERALQKRARAKTPPGEPATA